MKLLGRRGPYTLLYDDGTLPGERGSGRRRLWRARSDHDGSVVHVVVPGAGDGAIDGLNAGLAVDDARVEPGPSIVFPYAPGVFLLDLIAQGANEGGELPVEAAVFIVREVARRLERTRLQPRRRVNGGLVERVRVGFDGGVGLWIFSGEDVVVHALEDDDDDYNDRIGIFRGEDLRAYAIRVENDDDDAGVIAVIPALMGGRRNAPDDEAASPEEAAGGPGDDRSDVFVIGGLLWMALTGVHPFVRDNLLDSLGALRAASLPPLPRVLPDGLRGVLQKALDLSPAARFGTAGDLAFALDEFVDDDAGRAAVSALTRGLFPQAFADDSAFVEEALVVDIHAVPGALSTKPAARVRVPGVPGTALDVSTHLVTQAQVIAWADDDGVTLPPGFPIDLEHAHRPAMLLPQWMARRVAAWLGGRLPTDAEFSAYAAGGATGVDSRCGVVDLCLCWEWTVNEARNGHVVRGGPWRNREERGLVDNRSWDDEAAPDIGFRVVFDVSG